MTPDRTSLLAEADSILHRESFSKEDGARVAQLLALADQLVDRTDLRKATIRQRAADRGEPDPFPPKIEAPEADALLTAYMRSGGRIRGAQGAGSGPGGGYLVPASFSDRFFTVLQQTDEIFLLAQRWESATGSPSNYPVIDDVAQTAAIVAESAPSVESDMAFAAAAFGACPKFAAGPVVVSIELVNDSHFPIEALTAAALSVRFARGCGAYLIGKLLAGAGVGVTAASATLIAADEVWELVASLDAAYANAASFLMTRGTFSALMRLKGTSGNYMFPPTFDPVTGRPTLCGNYPVYFSPSMGALTAGQQPISFGSHGAFIRRDVKNSLELKVLTQKYALLGQLGYLAFLRVDGALPQGAAGHPVPVVTLEMAAS